VYRTGILVLLALALAGCLKSTTEASWTRDGVGWSLRLDEGSDSIEIRDAPDTPGSWSDWTVEESAHDLGVALDSHYGSAQTVTVPRDGKTGLGSLSSVAVQEGDVLRWCRHTGDRDFSFRLSNPQGGGGFSFQSLRACG
jgi:hypothetical protein